MTMKMLLRSKDTQISESISHEVVCTRKEKEESLSYHHNKTILLSQNLNSLYLSHSIPTSQRTSNLFSSQVKFFELVYAQV